MQGALATVEESTPGTMKVCSVASPSICPIPPADFLDVLRGWGQTWIWDNLKVTGGTDWVAQAIADNSLVVVTDGSYIKEHFPDLCSAAFVLECTQGRGRLVGAFAEAICRSISGSKRVLWRITGADGGSSASFGSRHGFARSKRMCNDIL